MTAWLLDIRDALSLIAALLIIVLGVAGAVGGVLWLIWGRDPR